MTELEQYLRSYMGVSDEDMEALDLDGERQRRRSMTSMPGSLDDMQFGMDDEDGGGDRDGDVEDGDYVEEGDGELCEFGEDAAQKAYEMALSSDVQLPAETYSLISSQKSALKSSHDQIKRLRDTAKV